MINQLHRLFHNPNSGWDPVPQEWANFYDKKEWLEYDPGIIKGIERFSGSLNGKKILDLGGGPGQFSIHFAKLGAQVTWYDISRHYREITQRHAAESGVHLQYRMGYFEDIANLERGTFDLVFNRVCWFYCMNDAHFAKLIADRLKLGGLVYIDALVGFEPNSSLQRRIRHSINHYFSYKIGHIRPPSGRVESLLNAYGCETLFADYSRIEHDLLILRKAI